MTIKALFQKLTSPVISFLSAAILKLSSLDGAPGLSTTDLSLALTKVVDLSKDNTSKAVKAQALAIWIRENFGARLPDKQNWAWIPDALGWGLVLVAKRLGLIR